LAAGIVIFIPWTADFVIYLIGGVVLSFPFFLDRRCVPARTSQAYSATLVDLGIAAPVAVVFVWLAADYVNYSLVDFSFLEFISLQGVMLRAALVFVCASFSFSYFTSGAEII
jgi:hypothetical protein